MDKLSVLVIDDSPQIREFVVEYILKPNGFEVDVAKDGAEGLKKVLAAKPDLVLMDLKLPVMDGFEAIRHMKSINRKIPVIVQSAYVMADQKEKAFNCGCNDFVSKPIDRLRFLTTISTHIL